MKNLLSVLFAFIVSSVCIVASPVVGVKQLDQKVTVVFGASKGIGKATAEVFAQEGSHVLLVSRSEDLLKANVNAINAQGGSASYVVADVNSQTDVVHVAETAWARYGKIDIVLYNTGIFPDVPFEALTEEDWDHVLNTNLKGAFFAVQSTLPYLKYQQSGRILFTSSISGPRVGLPGLSPYTASKGGLDGFMKTLALELVKYNITVNAVEPGNIMTEGVIEHGEEHIRDMQRAIPMGRLGKPEDIAYAFVFLASDRANFITGQSIIVDGGQVLPESQFMNHRGN